MDEDIGEDIVDQPSGGGGGAELIRTRTEQPDRQRAQPRQPAHSGWGFGGDDDAGGPVGGTAARVEESKKKPAGHWDDDVEEQLIPELEDEGNEDITTKVAAPPTVRTQNLQTQRELNMGISAPIPQYGDENIDLSILWQHLCTEAQVEDPDKPWDPEALFQEVSSELTKPEIDEGGEAAGDGNEAPAGWSG